MAMSGSHAQRPSDRGFSAARYPSGSRMSSNWRGQGTTVAFVQREINSPPVRRTQGQNCTDRGYPNL